MSKGASTDCKAHFMNAETGKLVSVPISKERYDGIKASHLQFIETVDMSGETIIRQIFAYFTTAEYDSLADAVKKAGFVESTKNADVFMRV